MTGAIPRELTTDASEASLTPHPELTLKKQHILLHLQHQYSLKKISSTSKTTYLSLRIPNHPSLPVPYHTPSRPLPSQNPANFHFFAVFLAQRLMANQPLMSSPTLLASEVTSPATPSRSERKSRFRGVDGRIKAAERPKRVKSMRVSFIFDGVCRLVVGLKLFRWL